MDHHNGHNEKQNKKGLLISFTLTATIMIVEFFGGIRSAWHVIVEALRILMEPNNDHAPTTAHLCYT